MDDIEKHIEAQLVKVKDILPAGFYVGLHIDMGTPRIAHNTYPTAWMEEYTRDGLLMQDPVVRWAFTLEGMMRWSDLEVHDTAGIFARGRGHGLVHGVAISLNDGDLRSVVTGARSDREITDDEMETLDRVLRVLHDKTKDY